MTQALPEHDTAPRVAVVYQYFETAAYRDNLIFFLARAWRPELEFFIVIAGDTSLDLPQKPNIHTVRTPNYGHDFAGYAQLVEDGTLADYDHVVFVNCTVRGPFLPPYDMRSWTQPFVALLQGDVHLCGATINILHDDRPFHALYRAAYPDHPPPYSHVQSSVHALTQEGLAFLRDLGLYSRAREMTKEQAVVDCEIAMSQHIKAAGWAISCLLPAYQAIDYRQPHQEINPTTNTGHPQKAGAYFGQTLHPYETVFLKTGWPLLSEQALDFHTLMALQHHPGPSLDWAEVRALRDRVSQRLQASFAPPSGAAS